MDYNMPSPTMEELEMAREKMPEEEYRRRQRQAQARYDKANTMMVTFKLNHANDADIIEHLSTVENRQGYIKGLIRKDIEENG